MSEHVIGFDATTGDWQDFGPKGAAADAALENAKPNHHWRVVEREHRNVGQLLKALFAATT